MNNTETLYLYDRQRGRILDRSKQVIVAGREYDAETAAHYMDDELREHLHSKMAGCSHQRFVDAYAVAHAEEFGEDWTIT